MSTAVAAAPSAVMPIREAYLRIKDEISAVKESDLINITVDVQSVVTSTRGRLPQILAFKERVAKEMPNVDVTVFDKLGDYTLATAYTHGQYRATSIPNENLAELLEEATTYRDTLLADATALNRRDIIDGSKLSELKGATGYKGTAFDLLTLYTLLRENWDKIQGRTALSLEELERAGIVADELMLATGVRESGPQMLASVILNRQRAFSLFAQAYDEVRRCIQFLRWNEGDADEIMPSLYAGRRRRPGSDLTSGDEPPAQGDSETPTGPATTSSPVSPVVTARTGVTAPTGTVVPTVGVGLPGSDPFGT